jgi:hypothetical protein
MDRAAIVANLSNQLPSWADRQAVCRATGLVDVQLAGDAGAVWASIVEEAEAQGRLEALLLAAAKYRPRDRTLAVMAGLPPPTARGGSWGLWVAFGALALMAVVARWQAPSGDEGAEVPDAERKVEAAAASAVPAAPAAVPPAPAPEDVPAAVDAAAAIPVAPPAAPSVAAPVPAPVVPVPAPVAAAAPIATPPAAAPVTPPAAPAEAAPAAGRRGACGGGGYAYVASGRAPGQGQVWTVPGSIYVRSDYPKASNGWDSKAGVVCALPAGARVELADAPLRIEGGAVWVRVRPDKILLP